MDRKALRAVRDAIPPQTRRALDDQIAGQVLACAAWRESRTVFCYVAIDSEVGTEVFLKAALGQGKTLAVPRCVAPRVMEAVRLERLDALRPGRFGIPEPPTNAPVLAPERVDLVLTPGLAFDVSGRRVGSGGGYYDRYFRGCARALRIALLYPCQLRLDLPPAMPWDEPVHGLVLPQEILWIDQEVTLR